MELKYFGNPGHFILSKECIFHITTLVNDKYLVSTVGELIKDPKGINDSSNWGEFGYGEGAEKFYYETMVFEGMENCPCGCGTPVCNGEECIDENRYKTAKEANEGHYEMCLKYSEL